MKFKFSRRLVHLLGLIVLFSVGAQAAWAEPAATTTALTVTSGGSVVASGGSVASGSKVTLTAAVVSGSTKVTVGQVNFCDASALSCTDIHFIGTAQLTSAGAAVISLHPAIGSHSYKAVFAGTPNGVTAYAGSVSGSMSLTMTGTMWPSVTSYAANSEVGNYTLTATVGTNASAAPTGTVSFLDAVSYTHLDVYKRQSSTSRPSTTWSWTPARCRWMCWRSRWMRGSRCKKRGDRQLALLVEFEQMTGFRQREDDSVHA